MKRIDFWFDPISPYAYLAFERLPEAFDGLSYSVAYRPVLFAALLKHWGHKGPAEIEPKRAWTFRQVHWLAHRHGIAMRRRRSIRSIRSRCCACCMACASPTAARRTATPARRCCATSGRAAAMPSDAGAPGGARGAARAAPRSGRRRRSSRRCAMPPTRRIAARRLRRADDRSSTACSFWGLDALDDGRRLLRGDPWFDGRRRWHRDGAPRPGVQRAS